MNISRGQSLDVVVTGAWSKKSLDEARKCAGPGGGRQQRGPASQPAGGVELVAGPEGGLRAHLLERDHPRVQFGELPDLALGSDALWWWTPALTSLSRPVDWSWSAWRSPVPRKHRSRWFDGGRGA